MAAGFNSNTHGLGIFDGDNVNVFKTDPKPGETDLDGCGDGEEVNVYGTAPNDLSSVPAHIGNLTKSFAGNILPAGWPLETPQGLLARLIPVMAVIACAVEQYPIPGQAAMSLAVYFRGKTEFFG